MFPGYKHVHKFGPDEDYEEDEVTYVTPDLGPNVDKALLPNTSEYRMAGLDTSTPMLQISGTFFQGTHEELIGTEIIFTDGHDRANPSRRFVVPVSTTEKRIRFRQVEVKEEDDTTLAGMMAPKPKPKPLQNLATGRGRGRGRDRGRGKGRSTKGQRTKASAKGKEPTIEGVDDNMST